jgi:hypothetical protein
VCALLPESVRACAREGLVSVDLVAGDGTKLKANASMATNVTAVDVQALEALLDQARQVLDLAGIARQIRKALFDAGYASDANFTLDTAAQLYIAVTREARQTGRSEHGRAPKATPR